MSSICQVPSRGCVPPIRAWETRVRRAFFAVVRFGPPLDFSRYAGLENDRYILRAVTDEIMYEVMRLSEQEYVDMYASKAKDLARDQAKAAEKRP